MPGGGSSVYKSICVVSHEHHASAHRPAAFAILPATAFAGISPPHRSFSSIVCDVCCSYLHLHCAVQIVTHATDTKNVVATCCGNELLRTLLPHLTEQLELCQKSLTAYLETKRAEFPRFYFVSDPTLLEILSLGSDPPSVVPHFQSGLFDSLTSVTFDKVCLLLSLCAVLFMVLKSQDGNAEAVCMKDPCKSSILWSISVLKT